MKRRLTVTAAVLVVLAALFAACGGGGQSTECKNYLSCADRTMGPDSFLHDAYGTAGTCWRSDVDAAERCTNTCKIVLDQLKLNHPDAGC